MIMVLRGFGRGLTVLTYLHVAALAFFPSGCATVSKEQVRRDKVQARISYDLGINALERGDTREALGSLLAAQRFDPKLADVHYALGLVYHSMAKTDKALSQYDEALALRPKFSEAHNNRGIVLLDMGRFDEAIAAFEVALGDILYATPTLAEGNMGWAFYKKGQSARAKEHIGNAVATDPKFCRGYEYLMRIAQDEHDAPAMVQQGQRFFRYCLADTKLRNTLRPDYRREIDLMRAHGLLQLGRKREAVVLLQACIAEADDTIEQDSPADQCAKTLKDVVF